MKKTLALLLCFAMLFTLLSVNVFAIETTETPSVSIGTSSIAEDGTTKFTINFEKFGSLKGIDVKATVSKGLEITGASSSSLDAATLKAGEDYVINADKNEIHIVSLTKIDTGAVITVNATLKAGTTEAQTIDVTFCELAKSGTELYTEYAAAAQVEVVPNKAAETEKPTEDTVKKQPTNSDWFIPCGGIYSGVATAPENVTKNADGSFNLEKDNSYTIQEFKVPTGGFGTYAVADTVMNATTPAKKFCNLVSGYDSSNKQYGSIVIIGDWDGFLAQYEGTKNASELIALLEARYTEKMKAGDERKFIPFEKNGKTIRVYKQPQTKHLWKGTSQLEYGVRVSGLKDGKQYAIVAYNCNKANNANTDRDGIVFATDIKSAVYTAAN